MNSAFAYLQFQSFTEAKCMADGVPTLKCLEVVFNNLLFLSSMIVILILFSMIVIGAFQYIMSRGNADALKKAKNTIMYAFIGLILFLSSYLILNVIQFLFVGDPEKDGVPSLLKFELPQFVPGDATGGEDGESEPTTGGDTDTGIPPAGGGTPRTSSPRTGTPQRP